MKLDEHAMSSFSSHSPDEIIDAGTDDDDGEGLFSFFQSEAAPEKMFVYVKISIDSSSSSSSPKEASALESFCDTLTLQINSILEATTSPTSSVSSRMTSSSSPSAPSTLELSLPIPPFYTAKPENFEQALTAAILSPNTTSLNPHIDAMLIHETLVPLLPIPDPLTLPIPDYEVQTLKNQYLRDGLIHLPNALSPQLFDSLHGQILPIIDSTLDKIATVKSLDPSKQIKFNDCMQRGDGRYDIPLPLNTLSSEFAKNVSLDDGNVSWLPLLASVLPPNSQIHRVGCVVSLGGSMTSAQQWHADGPSSLLPFKASCCFIPLINLTETTGFTTFWPGTQNNLKTEDLLARNVLDEIPKENLFAGDVSAGDVILYDYKAVHRGEGNDMEENGRRPIVYIVYACEEFVESNFAAGGSIDDFLKLKSSIA